MLALSLNKATPSLARSLQSLEITRRHVKTLIRVRKTSACALETCLHHDTNYKVKMAEITTEAVFYKTRQVYLVNSVSHVKISIGVRWPVMKNKLWTVEMLPLPLVKFRKSGGLKQSLLCCLEFHLIKG